MARDLKAIYDAIATEKNAQAELNGLQPAIDTSQSLLTDITTGSKVAIWRLWAWITAVAIWAHEKQWDVFKASVDAVAASAVPGTPKWYRDQALKFQYGYQLQWLDNTFSYDTIDEAAKIIKRAAVIEAGGQVRVKVAKLSGSNPVPLSSAELTAFTAYMKQIRFAGTNLAATSGNADLLKIGYTVYYDPLIAEATVKSAVEAAINSHISNLEFNGKLILTKLTDAIQEVTGVINPVLTLAQAKFGGNPYASIVNEYQSDAGYITIDPAFPLSTQITYTPYV